MPRLTLDVSTEQHRQLKTLSAYAGLSMKEFMLSRIFAEAAETVFENSRKSKNNDELEGFQDILFKSSKKHIILSEEKWIEIQKKVAANN